MFKNFMEDLKNKNLWIGGVVVLAVAAVLIFWLMGKPAIAPGVDDNLAQNNPVIDSVEDTTPGSINTGASKTATISYANALIKYKDARLQLDKACQGSPNAMTFKNGASLMIDNRAPVARVVKVGSIFNIKAYGFKIVKLSSSTLPATWLVDCDKSQNVATVTIQK